MNYTGTNSFFYRRCAVSTLYRRENMALDKIVNPFSRSDSDWLFSAMSTNKEAIRASLAPAPRKIPLCSYFVRMARPVLHRAEELDPRYPAALAASFIVNPEKY